MEQCRILHFIFSMLHFASCICILLCALLHYLFAIMYVCISLYKNPFCYLCVASCIFAIGILHLTFCVVQFCILLLKGMLQGDIVGLS